MTTKITTINRIIEENNYTNNDKNNITNNNWNKKSQSTRLINIMDIEQIRIYDSMNMSFHNLNIINNKKNINKIKYDKTKRKHDI